MTRNPRPPDYFGLLGVVIFGILAYYALMILFFWSAQHG